MIRLGAIRHRPAGEIAHTEVLRLLDQDGCALCHARDEASDVWVRWFSVEDHSDADTLTGLGKSLGFCPAHVRRPIALDKPDILRRPWESVLAAAISRTERLIQAGEAGDRPPCPACRAVVTRSHVYR